MRNYKSKRGKMINYIEQLQCGVLYDDSVKAHAYLKQLGNVGSLNAGGHVDTGIGWRGPCCVLPHKIMERRQIGISTANFNI